MMHVDFKDDSLPVHVCEAVRDGDWIIYTCPKCPTYRRRYNWRTAEMRVIGQNHNVRHSGSYRMLGDMN